MFIIDCCIDYLVIGTETGKGLADDGAFLRDGIGSIILAQQYLEQKII